MKIRLFFDSLEVVGGTMQQPPSGANKITRHLGATTRRLEISTRRPVDGRWGEEIVGDFVGCLWCRWPDRSLVPIPSRARISGIAIGFHCFRKMRQVAGNMLVVIGSKWRQIFGEICKTLMERILSVFSASTVLKAVFFRLNLRRQAEAERRFCFH